MATGILGTLDIPNASTNEQLYACPSGMVASFSVSMVNRTSSPVQVNIALTTSTSVSNGQYIAYNYTIYPYETYERSGLVLNEGQFIYVFSTATGVNAIAYGYEES
jgi:hypothetical protein